MKLKAYHLHDKVPLVQGEAQSSTLLNTFTPLSGLQMTLSPRASNVSVKSSSIAQCLQTFSDFLIRKKNMEPEHVNIRVSQLHVWYLMSDRNKH